MLGFAAFAMMASAAAQTAAPPVAQMPPGLAAQEVGRCGFASVTLRYDQALGQYFVVVPEIQSAPDDQLRCAARVSVQTNYHVDFRSPLNRRYDELYWPVVEGEGRADAREWLAKRGLLSKLPVYDSGKTDDLAFARKLEALCGPGAKGAFAIEQGTLILKSTSSAHSRLDSQTIECLTNAQWASGLPTGFTGQGYYPQAH